MVSSFCISIVCVSFVGFHVCLSSLSLSLLISFVPACILRFFILYQSRSRHVCLRVLFSTFPIFSFLYPLPTSRNKRIPFQTRTHAQFQPTAITAPNCLQNDVLAAVPSPPFGSPRESTPNQHADRVALRAWPMKNNYHN